MAEVVEGEKAVIPAQKEEKSDLPAEENMEEAVAVEEAEVTEDVDKAEEQETIWTELDKLSSSAHDIKGLDQKEVLPPQPSDFSTWFNTNNSVDLRTFMRDVEIVFIEAALERNNGNTSDAAKDLKLLRTTLIEKIKKYGI